MENSTLNSLWTLIDGISVSASGKRSDKRAAVLSIVDSSEAIISKLTLTWVAGEVSADRAGAAFAAIDARTPIGVRLAQAGLAIELNTPIGTLNALLRRMGSCVRKGLLFDALGSAGITVDRHGRLQLPQGFGEPTQTATATEPTQTATEPTQTATEPTQATSNGKRGKR